MADPGTDRDGLRRDDVYGTITPLRDRASLYDFLERRVDIVEWVLSFLGTRGLDALVADVGCGDGKYAARLAGAGRRVVALDLSGGMASTARAAVGSSCVAVGDVQALPWATAAVDAVIAPHMLYHPPEIGAAVAELARVLRPGGVLVALTNGSEHLERLWKTLMEARSEVAGVPFERYRPATDRFSLDNGGALLAPWFDVERHDLHNRLVVPDAAPLLRYVATVEPFLEVRHPSGAPWSDVVDAFGRGVAAVIERDGAWIDTTHSGVLVCRPRG